MKTHKPDLFGRIMGGLVVAAICLSSVGCAEINIDASNFKIPGLTAAGGGPAAPDRKAADAEAGIKSCGDMRCRIEF